jgi:hypothetical protein
VLLSRRALLTGALLVHGIIAVIVWVYPAGHNGDFQRFWQLGVTAGRAYRDFPAEYPPGALLLFDGVATAVSSPALFDRTIVGLNVLADAVIIAALLWAFGCEAATWFAVVVIPILSLLFFRMDLWPTAAVTLAVAAWSRGLRYQSAASLCLGAALKLWPLPFGALLLVNVWPRPHARNRWPLGFFIAAIAALGGAWYFYAGATGPAQVLTFRGATGWEIESGIGSLSRLFDPSTVRMESGSVRVGSTNGVAAVVLFLIAGPPSLWAIWRGASLNRLGTGWVAGIGALLSCSALLSPQFIGWLLPGAAIAWAEGDRRSGHLTAVIVLLTLTYRLLHTQPELVLLRNLVLVAMTVQAFVTLARASSRAAVTSQPASLPVKFAPVTVAGHQG